MFAAYARKASPNSDVRCVRLLWRCISKAKSSTRVLLGSRVDTGEGRYVTQAELWYNLTVHIRQGSAYASFR
jgi:hypothetical protein